MTQLREGKEYHIANVTEPKPILEVESCYIGKSVSGLSEMPIIS